MPYCFPGDQHADMGTLRQIRDGFGRQHREGRELPERRRDAIGYEVSLVHALGPSLKRPQGRGARRSLSMRYPL